MVNQKMMKICVILSPKLPVPAVKGGAIETLITNLIGENKEEPGIQLTICSKYDKKAEQVAKKGKFVNVRFFWTKRQYQFGFFMFRVIRKLFKVNIWRWTPHYRDVATLIQREKFDLIIAEGGDIRVVLDISKDDYETSNIAVRIHAHVLPRHSVAAGYGILIGVSNFVTNEYLKQCVTKPKSYVLRNCIDLSKFDKKITNNEKGMLRKKVGITPDDFVVLYVGRVSKEKGVLELTQAVSDITDLSVKLLIVGGPESANKRTSLYFEKIKCFANKCRDKIKITGYIPNEELYKYYQIADIQCVPSIWEEAAGLVVLEGMASGLPLIITDSGGMVEYVSDKTAEIVKRENLVVNLREAIVKLKSDEKKRTEMSMAAKEHVKKYSKEKYYDNFVKIIKDAVG